GQLALAHRRRPRMAGRASLAGQCSHSGITPPLVSRRNARPPIPSPVPRLHHCVPARQHGQGPAVSAPTLIAPSLIATAVTGPLAKHESWTAPPTFGMVTAAWSGIAANSPPAGIATNETSSGVAAFGSVNTHAVVSAKWPPTPAPVFATDTFPDTMKEPPGRFSVAIGVKTDSVNTSVPKKK